VGLDLWQSLDKAEEVLLAAVAALLMVMIQARNMGCEN
jgi:hypothetical protein